MTDVERQINILKEILAASEEEIHDIRFLLKKIKEYGIQPLAWLQELDQETNYMGDGMIQVPGEFASFCHFLVDMEIKKAIEVGVFRGRSSYFLCAILYRKNRGMIYDMVDIADYLDEFDKFAEVLPCLRKRIPMTSADFIKESYDFVFIDADHRYPGAMEDYLNVGRYAKKLVCFHDIYAHEYDTQEGGVVRLWEEVCAMTPQHPKMIFSQFPNRWMGIGVVLSLQEDETIVGREGDVETVKAEAEAFLTSLSGEDDIYIYGARNDSRRMYDALIKQGLMPKGLVIVSEAENVEDVKKYPIVLLNDIEDKEKVKIVLCLRESIREAVSPQLQEWEELLVVTSDKTASFLFKES